MTDDVTITLGIDGDREVERRLDNVQRASEDLARGVGGLDDHAGQAERAMRDLATGVDRHVDDMAVGVDRGVDRIGRGLRELGDDTDRTGRDFADLATDAERAARRIDNAFDDVHTGPSAATQGAVAGAAAGAASASLDDFAGEVVSSTGITDIVGGVLDPFQGAATVNQVAALIHRDRDDVRQLANTLQGRRGVTSEEALGGIRAAGQFLDVSALTDSQLVDVVDGLLALERADFGAVNEVADSIGKVSGAFEVDDIAGLVDAYAALATSPGATGEIAEVAREYSGAAAALGQSAEDFLGSLQAAADPSSGLFSVDKVGDALLEAQIRLTEDSDDIRGALEQIGLSAQQVQDDISAGGEVGAAAFQDVVAALRDVEDDFEQRNLVRTLIGTPAEDLADVDALLGVLDRTEARLTGSADAAERLAEQLNDTWVQRFLAGAYDSAFGFGLFGGQVRDPEALAERDRAHRAGAANQRGALGALQGLPQQTTIHVEYRPTIEAGVVTQIDSVRRLLEQQAPFLARLIDRRLQQAQVFSARRGGLLE